MNFKNIAVYYCITVVSFFILPLSASSDFKDEELAQLFILGYPVQDLQQMKRDSAANIGGIILFRQNVHSRKQLQQNIASLKRINPKLLVAVDQEGGRIQRLNRWNGFPDIEVPRVSVVATMPIGAIRRLYDRQARVLNEMGVNLNLAPVVDLELNLDGPISHDGRSFGSLDKVVSTAQEVILAHQKHGVLTALKHFPGHGSASDDSHDGFTDVTREWSEQELEPYRILMRTMPGAIKLVMTSHLYNAQLDKQYPATMSKKTVQLLTGKLGFQGVVISDDMNMGALLKYSLGNRLKRALIAGHHILIYSNKHNERVTLNQLVGLTRKLLEAGELSPAVVSSALDKISRLKQSL